MRSSIGKTIRAKYFPPFSNADGKRWHLAALHGHSATSKYKSSTLGNPSVARVFYRSGGGGEGVLLIRRAYR